MHLKLSSGNWRPCCLGLNVLLSFYRNNAICKDAADHDRPNSKLLRSWWFQGFRLHDDVIKWQHFLRYRPFVWGIHRSPVNSPHKGQWRGVLMFSLIFARINGWVNTGEAGDLRRNRCHYDVIVMVSPNVLVPIRPRTQFNLSNAGPVYICIPALTWRHNGQSRVWNHQRIDCLFNRLFRLTSKKKVKARVRNAETIFIWWRHHAVVFYHVFYHVSLAGRYLITFCSPDDVIQSNSRNLTALWMLMKISITSQTIIWIISWVKRCKFWEKNVKCHFSIHCASFCNGWAPPASDHWTQHWPCSPTHLCVATYGTV